MENVINMKLIIEIKRAVLLCPKMVLPVWNLSARNAPAHQIYQNANTEVPYALSPIDGDANGLINPSRVARSTVPINTRAIPSFFRSRSRMGKITYSWASSAMLQNAGLIVKKVVSLRLWTR